MRLLGPTLVALLILAGCHHPAPVANDASVGPVRAPAIAAHDAAVEDHFTLLPVVVAAASHPRSANRTARADEHVSIAAGSYSLGSTPGDLGRDPALEADGIPITVPAFDIDALPFPNDPAQPVRTGATRDEAEALCHTAGRRLCTEIEWERACRGPLGTIFPNGDRWEPEHCAGRGNPGECASGYGALVMGARSAEWTSDNLDQRAVIRGGAATAAEAVHRCASRRTALAEQPGLEIAFRCCGGARPAISYPHEISRPPFREEPMSVSQLAQIVSQVPELARVRDGLAIFSPAATAEVLNHGATTAEQHPEVTFTVNPVRWSPTFGEDLLVFTAMSTVGSFVAALWVVPSADGHGVRYRHASSFILAGDRISMTLAYGPSTREEVQWSACWNCGGEHGVVHYDAPTAHVVTVQR